MKNVFILMLLSSFFWSCQNSNTALQEKSLDEIKSESKIRNSSIVRNPVTANQPEDTVNVARMVFEEESFDFGEVNEGETVTHVYEFKNTGKVPLVISNARSTCGCTVPKWPNDPIPPGESGQIEVKFNTQNKKNKQTKPITITANTYPSATKVYLTGFVNPKEEDNASVVN